MVITKIMNINRKRGEVQEKRSLTLGIPSLRNLRGEKKSTKDTENELAVKWEESVESRRVWNPRSQMKKFFLQSKWPASDAMIGQVRWGLRNLWIIFLIVGFIFQMSEVYFSDYFTSVSVSKWVLIWENNGVKRTEFRRKVNNTRGGIYV